MTAHDAATMLNSYKSLESFRQPVLLVSRAGTLLASNYTARVLLNLQEDVVVNLLELIDDKGAAAELLAAVQDANSASPVAGPTVMMGALTVPCTVWLSSLADGGNVLCSLEAASHTARSAEFMGLGEYDGQLFHAIPTPVVLCELQSRRLLDASLSYFELVGVESGVGMGAPLWEQGAWQSREQYERVFSKLHRMGSVRDVDVTLVTTDHEQIECVLEGERCLLGGREVALLAVTDVSARKRAERASAILEMQVRQSQKLEAIGTLAGGIAHDFNNILGSIVARSALIDADAGEPEMVRQHVREINVATERAKALVRRILTFSRQKAQERAPVQVDAALREALDLVRPTLPSSTSIELDVQAGVPEIMADPTQIHQAIINLCTNASQALQGRAGTVTISLRPVAVDQTMVLQVPELRCGKYACLTVTDTGHGMTAETLERVFDPFFTTKGPGQGTGLGLAVVHGVVKEHEGAIVVDSAPEIGTSFQLYFPETTVRERTQSEAPPEVVVGSNEHVLLVDDEESLCNAIASLLRRSGYRVTTFTDPEQALAFLERELHEVDVLLTDLTMPKLTGVDLSKAATRLRPDLPVIVTSGYTANWDQWQGLRDGVLEFRQKPVGFAELSQSIRSAIEHSRRRAGKTG